MTFSVVFDLDGTLVDTAPDLAAAMNAALAEEARPPIPLATVRHMVGKGARALIERGLAATGGPIAPERMEALLRRFLEHYGDNIIATSRPFPGAVAALERLALQGAKLGICTNKPQALTLKLLDGLGLTERFGAVLGADVLPVKKPHPRHLLETIARLGGRPERAIMVGDSETDVATARAAGVPVVAVTFGYTALTPEALGADRLIDRFDALDNAVAALL